ncbi:MAG TPA: hypothetical protein VF211_03130 [Burkholderiales bacterium]
MLDRQTLFLVVLGLSIANGIFSPLLRIAMPISAALLPELFPRTIHWVLFWASILVATVTLLLSGVPAALYERFVERDAPGTGSMWIWLAGAVLLSLPALL